MEKTHVETPEIFNPWIWGGPRLCVFVVVVCFVCLPQNAESRLKIFPI